MTTNGHDNDKSANSILRKGYFSRPNASYLYSAIGLCLLLLAQLASTANFHHDGPLAWTVGKTNRFAATVVAKPVINWLIFTLTADSYPYSSQYWMAGKPWEVQDHLWKHSPVSLVGDVSTPTMLITGEQDYPTPISKTEQYYQALKLANVTTAMITRIFIPNAVVVTGMITKGAIKIIPRL